MSSGVKSAEKKATSAPQTISGLLHWQNESYACIWQFPFSEGFNLGHNCSTSYCFQVQPVTCCDLSVFLHKFEAHSIDSSKMVRKFPEPVLSETQPVHLYLVVGSSRSSSSLQSRSVAVWLIDWIGIWRGEESRRSRSWTLRSGVWWRILCRSRRGRWSWGRGCRSWARRRWWGWWRS